jgi:hypothetical protein
MLKLDLWVKESVSGMAGHHTETQTKDKRLERHTQRSVTGFFQIAAE